MLKVIFEFYAEQLVYNKNRYFLFFFLPFFLLKESIHRLHFGIQLNWNCQIRVPFSAKIILQEWILPAFVNGKKVKEKPTL